ncbi:Sjogren's syndrome/scleroderma autoantigen 1 family protein [Natrarchaeobaculum sulfurireducens]|uniref:Putative Zn-finger containing protein n=1 Tax=Natrarchaeobaculum sulfurireducens TaxID=2044521 RepID=A0A346PKN5_9EURY|nr:Sjogren's syndrome/scleroderma autoantigen 1 family protein [Natrarchaeobaculum sulfurireducens]AXR76402.1 putative Zn-finger containing protein [Natrarchaeobaculum sulfurireducens]AXR80080.1 hypothetical protein AArcMg_0047 [Natrarchaeobaculum sulfurireducens]
MSDSDAGDDEGIDKEALREELREKYERDEREREATQRMSDLLLKGATMTNAHCGTCGDPLFQQNGTTFCPGCHGGPEAVEGTGLEDATDDGASDQGTPDAGKPGTDAEPSLADEPAPSPDRPSEDGPTGPVDRRQRAPDPDSDATADVERVSSTGSSPTRNDRQPVRPKPRAASTSEFETARDSLQRALEKFAAEAASTDDPRYARECLEAAREASETLSTLR